MEENLSVVVIDDNPFDRVLCIRELRREFPTLRVSEVIDGRGFKHFQNADRPDLVITDYQLCWTDGLTVLRTVKEVWEDCPVIMFTGTGTEEIAVEAMKSGLDDYVIKSPRHFTRLPGLIRSVLKRSEYRRRAHHWEKRLHGLLTQLNMGVCRFEPQGTILEANPAFYLLLNQPANGVESLSLRDFFRDSGAYDAMAKELAKHGRFHEREIEMRRQDGQRIWISLTCTLGATAAGEAVVDCLMDDISERKRGEEMLRRGELQIRQAQKMETVGRLAGGVAHDFNNLLTVIVGHCDLLMTRLGEDERIKADIQEIKKSGERAAALTRQLLAFGRKQMMQAEIIDLNATINGMAALLDSLVGDAIRLETRLDPVLGCVKADPGQIEQVLANLVVNARDAMPRGGNLNIRTRNVNLDEGFALECGLSHHEMIKPGPYAMIAVSDTGRGMDAETKAHLFEPFFTTKPFGFGPGLGLSTVYGIVRQSEGIVLVDSEPGRGATFRVYLPRLEHSLDAMPPRLPGAGEERQAPTILVVEDEASVRELLVQILEREDYNVLTARDGREALHLCRSYTRPIHLLLTDVMMSEMHGDELVELALPLRPDMKILLISGYPNEEIVKRCRMSPGMVFMEKPFHPEELNQKLRELLPERAWALC